MIGNFRKSIMGTAEFVGRFTGMRKPQDFIVYPMHGGGDATAATVQSDTRIGSIDLATGDVRMSRPKAGGAFFADIPHGSPPMDRLSGEELLLLKAAIFGTAGANVGNVVVRTDNRGAADAFGGSSQ